MNKRLMRSSILATVFVLGLAGTAAAQWQPGIRAGVSAEPDQFFFGGHVESDELLEHLTFRPNAELGLGDHVTLLALNIEFVYSIPLQGEPWRVYLGAGPAANLYSIDRARGDDSGVRGGFNLLVGVQHDKGLFTELKVGAIDSPNLKFSVGYAFRPR